MKRRLRVLGIDAGGTMTDTFLIDESGDFVVGKARSTPEDESVGFLKSCVDALHFWDMTIEEGMPAFVSGVYSGTAMLNRLLSRKGEKIGLLVTAGMEDYLVLERGIQTYLGFTYSDRLHVATHYHNPPLVPKERIRGVPERIDLFGATIIPLYEEVTRQAVRELLDQNVDSLCVCLLHSYRNPSNEMTVRDIAKEVMAERKLDLPVFLSSELYPMRGDFPRLNTLLVEAYAANPSRDQVKKIQKKIKALGAGFELRVMASHGGTISSDAKELARTLVSGPIGGVIGAQFLGRALDIKNLVCTDIGGTSFDLALITDGKCQVNSLPDIARFVLCLPQLQVESIGAGTGSFVRINPNNNRIEIGPDSAGSRIGVCYPDGGLTTVSVTDCHIALGYIDPENFLGREILLDKEKAIRAIEEQVAKPLGMDVYEAAAGVVDILENNLRNQVLATIVGRGYSPANYTLISYGGGGPLHVAGYTQGMKFDDILVPTWAAGFSAYGCGCADLEYRKDISLDTPIPAGMPVSEKEGIVDIITGQSEYLKSQIVEEYEKSGLDIKAIEFRIGLGVQYLGQLNDLEVSLGKDTVADVKELDAFIAEFEAEYGRIYALSAKSPELGYLITKVIVTGRMDVEKPNLPARKIMGKVPPKASRKPGRKIFLNKKWATAAIYDMAKLEPGNEVYGPAVIEAASTTFVIPADRYAVLDKHLIFHLKYAPKKAKAAPAKAATAKAAVKTRAKHGKARKIARKGAR